MHLHASRLPRVLARSASVTPMVARLLNTTTLRAATHPASLAPALFSGTSTVPEITTHRGARPKDNYGSGGYTTVPGPPARHFSSRPQRSTAAARADPLRISAAPSSPLSSSAPRHNHPRSRDSDDKNTEHTARSETGSIDNGAASNTLIRATDNTTRATDSISNGIAGDGIVDGPSDRTSLPTTAAATDVDDVGITMDPDDSPESDTTRRHLSELSGSIVSAAAPAIPEFAMRAPASERSARVGVPRRRESGTGFAGVDGAARSTLTVDKLWEVLEVTRREPKLNHAQIAESCNVGVDAVRAIRQHLKSYEVINVNGERIADPSF